MWRKRCKSRRRHSVELKFKVALEAAKGLKTLNEIASEFSLHPNLVSQWKQQLLDGGQVLFRPSGRLQLTPLSQK